MGKVISRGHVQKENAVGSRIQIAGVAIDASIHQLTVDGQNVQLTATEFRLLKLLMERKVVSNCENLQSM